MNEIDKLFLKGIENEEEMDVSLQQFILQEKRKFEKTLFILLQDPEFQKTLNSMRNIDKSIKATQKLTSDEFLMRYSHRIELSKRIGNNGWVISFWRKKDFAKICNELIVKKRENDIVKIFEANNEELLLSIIQDLKDKYINGQELLYFTGGIEQFKNENYMASAMFLLSLLDYRFSLLIERPDGYMNNRDKYSEKGFYLQKQKEFSNMSEYKQQLRKVLYFTEGFPSLITYMKRTFCDGNYSFKNGVEPPYLNRNWLMHGRMARQVERYECIQILNTLDILEMMCHRANVSYYG